jgi:hypothetical protein
MQHVFEEHLILCAYEIDLVPGQLTDSIGYNVMNFVYKATVDNRQLKVLNPTDVVHKLFFVSVENFGDACIMVPLFELD